MFGEMGKMMKLAMEMKTKLPALKEKLAAAMYFAQAGGGVVAATVNGRLGLVDLKIDRSLLDGQADAGMLEDLVKAAVCAAQDQASQAAREAMMELTGGMKIPGMDGIM